MDALHMNILAVVIGSLQGQLRNLLSSNLECMLVLISVK